MVEQVFDQNRKIQIAQAILTLLPEWFGIPEAREQYILNSADQVFLAELEQGQPRGFLCLAETSKDTIEISVLGVLKAFHHLGIGQALMDSAKAYALKEGYSFMQVKTVQRGYDKYYDITNQFYQKMGFKEFEVMPTLWGINNPCQIYVLSLK